MTKFYWHVDPNRLVEPIMDSLEKRIKYLKYMQRKGTEILLKLMREVRGELPELYRQAWKNYERAYEAYERAGAVFLPLETQAKVVHNLESAWEDCLLAFDSCAEEINALHKIECPDCPWDGKSIFGR